MAERKARPVGRPARLAAVRAAALAAGLAAVLAGCAQIPTSGVPGGPAVADVPEAVSSPGVRVFAEGPRDGDNIYAIVSGFLEASGTVEDDFATARKYLTPDASEQWDPTARISIYDHTETTVSVSDQDSERLEFSSPAAGTVDDQGVFTPTEPGREVLAGFGLTQVEGNWRIERVPPGLYISRQDFDREYTQVDVYFLAAEPRSPVLVPDPVYVPNAGGLPGTLMDSLLRGPSRWLSPAVMSAAPEGAALAEPVMMASGVARVQLTPESVPADGVERDNLLAQIAATLTQDRTDVTAVEVSAGGVPVKFGGAGPAQLREDDVAEFLPPEQRPPNRPAYFLRDGVAFTDSAPEAQGPFAPERKLAEIAAQPGGGAIAGISRNRRTLVTAPSADPTQVEARLKGTNLRLASYDGDGNLWVVDGDGVETVVRRIPPIGDAVEVNVEGFLPRQVTGLRVASDGTRMALVLDTIEGAQAHVGLVTEDAAGVALAGLRRLAPDLLEPQAVDWADLDQLVVVGAEPDAEPQPFLVQLGGSSVSVVAAPPGDIAAVTVAPGQPMIASTADDMIFRLSSRGIWQSLGAGAAPTYPG